MKFPRMVKIKQKVSDKSIKDIPKYLKEKITASKLFSKIKKGETIAITVGSRGITEWWSDSIFYNYSRLYMSTQKTKRGVSL